MAGLCSNNKNIQDTLRARDEILDAVSDFGDLTPPGSPNAPEYASKPVPRGASQGDTREVREVDEARCKKALQEIDTLLDAS